MNPRPSPVSSLLPSLRPRRRIDWTRLLAQILCTILGTIGLLPIALTFLARSASLNAWATRESASLLAQQGLHAAYTIQVKLVPLALELTDVKLDASDGQGPALTSDRISARPRIFALLAGKLVIDQIEIDEPAIRLVLKDGELQNLPIKLPKDDGKKHPLRAPFSVLAVTAASVDLTVDAAHLAARDIDIDLTSDEAGPEGSSFEIATRIGKATFSRPRPARAGATNSASTPATFDDDALCSLDARIRYEPHLVTVRRFSAEGSADLDAAPNTAPECGLPANDKRRVEIALNHLRVAFPEGAPLPRVDGHLRVRAPIRLAERAASLPETDGWVGLDADVRYDDTTTIPELDGHFEAHDVRLERYRFAKEIQADLAIHKNVIHAPKLTVGIADGLATLTDVQVEPLAKGVPLKARFDAAGVSFTALMRDLGISDHAHVTWDVKELHVPLFKGTIVPLHIDGDLTGHTANFVVADRAIDDPAHARILGFREASLASHVAIRPTALEFQAVHSVVGKSVIDDGLCSIGFDNHLKVDAPKSSIDLADITPLGDIALAGQAEAQVQVSGLFSNPHLEADAQINGFSLGDIPFGNVTAGHVSFEGTAVDLKNVKATKGKSQYELPQARLEFGGKAKMELDGVATTSALGLRDFLSVWKMDDDPRFDDLDASLATRASIHLAMGGAEDVCGGGLIDVRAGVHATQLKLYGEQFDDGDADLEFRQFDRQASMQGTEVTVRALTLHKYHPQGKEPSGSVLGSGRITKGGVLHASVVMEAIPLFRVQSLGALRAQTEGAVSGLAVVDGTLDEFAITSDLDVTPIRIRGTPLGSSHLHVRSTQTSTPPPASARPAGKTRCGNAIAPPFDKEAYLADKSQKGEITVDGDMVGSALHLEHFNVTRAPNPVVTGKITLKDLDLGALSRVVTPAEKETPEELAAPEGAPKDELEGSVSGVLAIERAQVGSLEHAKVKFTPSAFSVARGAERMVMRPTSEVIALDEDKVTIPPLILDLQAARGLKGAVTLRGSVAHATHEPDLGVAMDLSPIDLGLLVGVVPRLERATGTLQGSVKLSGKLGAPAVSGDLRVTGGELSIKGLPSIVSDLNVDLRAGADELRIVQATAKFGGGTIAMHGGVPLKQILDGVGEAQLSARGIHLSPADGVTATVDADITLGINSASNEGALARLPRITGDVIVTQFEYARPINLTTDLSAFGVRAKRTVVETYDPTLDALTFELRLRAHAPLRIRNNLIEAQLGLESDALTVSGTNQRIGLGGDLKALPGGRFHLRGNDFDVRQALIRFDDPTRIAPNVDVVAVTEYRRYTDTAASSAAGASSTTGIAAGGGSGTIWRITLHAYGDADNLRLEMTSDPPLSQEDIVLLLTIGMTRAEVDQLQAGSLGTSAALEALATVSGADKAVKQAIPIIDDFRFGSAYSPRSGKTEPQVTVGKRLTENVRASVSSGLSSDSDREVRSNVEWRLNNRLSVRGSYDNINDVSSTVGNVGVDLRWRLEFE
jgi:translocation and assembly module TamB